MNKRKKLIVIILLTESKKLTHEEIFFEKIQFTTPKQFNNLKQYLIFIISQIKKLQDSLSDQEHSNRLGKILDIPEFKQGLRYDDGFRSLS